MSERITKIAKEKMSEQEKKKKLKGILKKIKYAHKHPSPGSVGERISSAYENRRTFKGMIDSGMSPDEARKSLESRTKSQRMIRAEYDRQMRIKKQEDKKKY